VAVAIIRRRPTGLTGQQYAERLCSDYQQSILKWKHRADSLQDELLQLQQAIVQSELVISNFVGDSEENQGKTGS